MTKDNLQTQSGKQSAEPPKQQPKVKTTFNSSQSATPLGSASSSGASFSKSRVLPAQAGKKTKKIGMLPVTISAELSRDQDFCWLIEMARYNKAEVKVLNHPLATKGKNLVITPDDLGGDRKKIRLFFNQESGKYEVWRGRKKGRMPAESLENAFIMGYDGCEEAGIDAKRLMQLLEKSHHERLKSFYSRDVPLAYDGNLSLYQGLVDEKPIPTNGQGKISSLYRSFDISVHTRKADSMTEEQEKVLRKKVSDFSQKRIKESCFPNQEDGIRDELLKDKDFVLLKEISKVHGVEVAILNHPLIKEGERLVIDHKSSPKSEKRITFVFNRESRKYDLLCDGKQDPLPISEIDHGFLMSYYGLEKEDDISTDHKNDLFKRFHLHRLRCFNDGKDVPVHCDPTTSFYQGVVNGDYIKTKAPDIISSLYRASKISMDGATTDSMTDDDVEEFKNTVSVFNKRLTTFSRDAIRISAIDSTTETQGNVTYAQNDASTYGHGVASDNLQANRFPTVQEQGSDSNDQSSTNPVLLEKDKQSLHGQAKKTALPKSPILGQPDGVKHQGQKAANVPPPPPASRLPSSSSDQGKPSSGGSVPGGGVGAPTTPDTTPASGSIQTGEKTQATYIQTDPILQELRKNEQIIALQRMAVAHDVTIDVYYYPGVKDTEVLSINKRGASSTDLAGSSGTKQHGRTTVSLNFSDCQSGGGCWVHLKGEERPHLASNVHEAFLMGLYDQDQDETVSAQAISDKLHAYLLAGLYGAKINVGPTAESSTMHVLGEPAAETNDNVSIIYNSDLGLYEGLVNGKAIPTQATQAEARLSSFYKACEISRNGYTTDSITEDRVVKLKKDALERQSQREEHELIGNGGQKSLNDSLLLRPRYTEEYFQKSKLNDIRTAADLLGLEIDVLNHPITNGEEIKFIPENVSKDKEPVRIFYNQESELFEGYVNGERNEIKEPDDSSDRTYNAVKAILVSYCNTEGSQIADYDVFSLNSKIAMQTLVNAYGGSLSMVDSKGKLIKKFESTTDSGKPGPDISYDLESNSDFFKIKTATKRQQDELLALYAAARLGISSKSVEPKHRDTALTEYFRRPLQEWEDWNQPIPPGALCDAELMEAADAASVCPYDVVVSGYPGTHGRTVSLSLWGRAEGHLLRLTAHTDGNGQVSYSARFGDKEIIGPQGESLFPLKEALLAASSAGREWTEVLMKAKALEGYIPYPDAKTKKNGSVRVHRCPGGVPESNDYCRSITNIGYDPQTKRCLAILEDEDELVETPSHLAPSDTFAYAACMSMKGARSVTPQEVRDFEDGAKLSRRYYSWTLAPRKLGLREIDALMTLKAQGKWKYSYSDIAYQVTADKLKRAIVIHNDTEGESPKRIEPSLSNEAGRAKAPVHIHLSAGRYRVYDQETGQPIETKNDGDDFFESVSSGLLCVKEPEYYPPTQLRSSVSERFYTNVDDYAHLLSQ